jgi:hypothetical protein
MHGFFPGNFINYGGSNWSRTWARFSILLHMNLMFVACVVQSMQGLILMLYYFLFSKLAWCVYIFSSPFLSLEVVYSLEASTTH